MHFQLRPPVLAAILALLTATVCAAANALADSGQRKIVRGDLIAMQGKWTLVEFTYFNGDIERRPPQDQIAGEMTVKGNRYHLKLRVPIASVDDDYTLKLYPGGKPRAFDAMMPDGRVIEGIYEIKGDTMRRCYTQPGNPRPTKFLGGNQTFQKWQRVKPRLK